MSRHRSEEQSQGIMTVKSEDTSSHWNPLSMHQKYPINLFFKKKITNSEVELMW